MIAWRGATVGQPVARTGPDIPMRANLENLSNSPKVADFRIRKRHAIEPFYMVL